MPRFEAGNPGGPGRPKGSGRVQACQDWAEKEGWETLFLAIKGYRRVINPDSEKVQLVAVEDTTWKECIKLALAYAVGKPAQRFEIGGEPGSLRDLLAGLTSPAGTGAALPTPRKGAS